MGEGAKRHRIKTLRRCSSAAVGKWDCVSCALNLWWPRSSPAPSPPASPHSASVTHAARLCSNSLRTCARLPGSSTGTPNSAWGHRVWAQGDEGAKYKHHCGKPDAGTAHCHCRLHPAAARSPGSFWAAQHSRLAPPYRTILQVTAFAGTWTQSAWAQCHPTCPSCCPPSFVSRPSAPPHPVAPAPHLVLGVPRRQLLHLQQPQLQGGHRVQHLLHSG